MGSILINICDSIDNRLVHSKISNVFSCGFSLEPVLRLMICLASLARTFPACQGSCTGGCSHSLADGQAKAVVAVAVRRSEPLICMVFAARWNYTRCLTCMALTWY